MHRTRKTIPGSVKELLFLDVSARASLSTKADRFLRGIEIADKFMDASSGMASMMQDPKDEDISIEGDQVKEFVLRFLQVQSLDTEELVRAGFDKAGEIRECFFSFLTKMLAKLTDKTVKIKNDIGGVVHQYEPVLDFVAKWDDQGIAKIRNFENTDSSIKTLAAGWVGMRTNKPTGSSSYLL